MFTQVLDRMGSRRRRNKQVTANKKRTRLSQSLKVETLEERRLLASFAWVGTDSVDWSDADNWNVVDAVGDAGADGVPDNDDTIIFSDTTPGVTNTFTNNDIVGLAGMNIQFDDGFGAPDFQILGNSIDLAPGVAVLQTRDSQSDNILVDLVTNGSTFQVDAGFLTVSGTITGTGGITKTGAGRLDLGNFNAPNNNYTGPTTVAEGRLFDRFADNILPDAGTVNVDAGANLTIFENETVGDVVVGGVLEMPSVLTTNDFTVTGVFDDIDINAPGVTPGTDYDQVVANGTVTIGDATFQVNGNHLPSVGEVFVIIRNDGADPVVLNANAPAPGTIVATLNGAQLQIFYDGGDGNDVILTPATADIIGYKFEDLNANGIEDAGDPRLDGVLIYSDVNLNGQIDPGEPTTVTGPVDLNGDGNIDPATENGIYVLQVVAGQEQNVRESVAPPLGQTTADPGGITLAYPSDPGDPNFAEPVVVAAGLVLDPNDQRNVTVSDEVDFGNAYEGAIYGFKFEDLDGDGVFDAGEPGLPGVTFTLQGFDGQDNFVAATAVTDADGVFVFDNLFPSVLGLQGYTIIEQPIPGFQPTTPSVASFDLFSREVLVYTGGNVQVNPPQVAVNNIDELIFGNTAPGSIHLFKFEDSDGNGVQDAGENPQANVGFTLTGTDGMGNAVGPFTIPTNVDGRVDFTQLLPGNYRVTETVPAGYVSSTPPIVRDFTIDSRQELVWAAGAAMLPPAPVPQLDQEQTLSDPNVPNLPTQENLFTAQTFVPGVTGQLTQVELSLTSLQAADTTLELQFVDSAGIPNGVVLASSTLTSAQITDGDSVAHTFVFNLPANVVQGLQYALVLSSPGTLAITGAALRWDFSPQNPYGPGTSVFSNDSGVSWNPSADLDQVFSTTMLPAADPRVVVLLDTADANGLVFGNTPAGSIHGYKFEDVNGNGDFDGLDFPLDGVTFVLTGVDVQGNDVQELAVTDFFGQFNFENLLPSDVNGYTVTETLPLGFVSTTGLLSRTYDVAPGEELVYADDVSNFNPNVQFENNIGVALMFGNTAPGSIHGYKFEDQNGSGFQDLLEPDQPNVTFTLTDFNGDPVNDAAGNLVAPFTTGADGRFEFLNLLPGEYQATEQVPAGFAPTTGPISRFFTVQSGQELVWQFDVAGIPDPPPAAPDVAHAGPIDAANVVDGIQVVAQTFTPTVSGTLTEVVLSLDIGATADEATLFVLPVNAAGLPSPRPLGFFSVSAAELQAIVGTDVPFDFTGAPVDLVAGQTYALALVSGSPTGELTWNASAGDAFAGGVGLQTDNNGVTWTPTDSDQIFATTILPEADPRFEVLVGQFGEQLVFGNTLTSSVHGLKFEDVDGDGVYTVGTDLALPGVTIQLNGTDSLDRPVSRLVVTDANGQFNFEGLFPSDDFGYSVSEFVPPGFVPTTPAMFDGIIVGAGEELVWQLGAANLPTGDPRIEVLRDQDGSGFDEELMFGNTVYGSIHGFKYEDINGNGQFDPNFDQPLPDVEFHLDVTFADGAALIITFSTDVFGRFELAGLAPSVAGVGLATGYTLTEVPRPGFTVIDPITFDLRSRQEFVFEAGAAGIPPAPAAELDQVQDQQDFVIGFALAVEGAGQTFRPAVTGQLTQVDFEVDLDNPNGTLVVEVRSLGADGLPAGAPLGMATVDLSTLPTGPQTLPIAFAGPPIELVAGIQYAIRVTSTDPLANPVGFGLATPGNAYPDGDLFFDFTGLATDNDLVFRTTMLPSPDPRLEIVDPRFSIGNIVPGSIHGFKFQDIDGNGLFDGGDTPLAGVEFILDGALNGGGAIAIRTFTGPDGQFEFTGLFPGTYTVTETVPAPYVASTPTERTFDLLSRDEFVWAFGAANLPTGDPRVEVLASMNPNANFGEELMFGNFVPGSIHGVKFEDVDADGIRDPDEPGLENIPFQLTGVDNQGNVVDVTVLTGADGEFDFENLVPSVAGTLTPLGTLATGYTVTELVPAGFPATTPTSFFLNVRAGEEFVAVQGQSTAVFGPRLDQFQPVANDFVSGNATDFPAQTFQPSVSGPLAVVSLEFTGLGIVAPPSDVIVEIQATDLVTGLPEGTVLASQTLPLGAITFDGSETRVEFTTPATMVAGVSYAIVVRSETNTTSFDIATNTANAYGNGTALVTNDGGATFAAVPGTDLVFSTFITQRLNVELPVQQFLPLDQVAIVGNTVNGSIHGFKYEDIDGNGIYDDAIDSPLAGVVFTLTGTLANGTEVVLQTTTDATGEFWFSDLTPNVAGNGDATGYTLTEQSILGFFSTTGTVSVFDLESRQEFVWMDGASDVDPTDPNENRVEVLTADQLTFGNVAPGSIHGFKFDDYDGDGVYEPNAGNPGAGDFGQEGVTFLLEGTDSFGFVYSVANQTALTQETDNFGDFWFTNLLPSIDGQPSAIPGVLQTGYTITEVVPTGFVPTTPPIARTLDLQSRQEFVWEAGAAMLPAVPVEAVDQSLPVPAGSAAGALAASGGIVAIQTFTPSVSGTLTNLQIPITTSATVSSDVVVTIHTVNSLGEPTENVLATATIAAANVPIGDNQPADFVFNLPLVAGQQYAWAITSATPVGESVSVLNIGGNPYAGGNAFQANPGFLPGNTLPNTDVAFSTTMLPTADPRVEVLIDVDQNGFNEDLMWGNTLPGAIHGYKYNDVNGNGIVDLADGTTPAEPRLAGFTIQLRDEFGNPVTDADGNVIPDQITDANGEYWFVNLLPGTYFVREVQQDGYVQTTHDPQPYTITRGQVYVGHAGQGMLDRDDPRTEIVDKCLIFGNTLTSSIFGYKFNDINADGDDEAGTDPRLAGVTITLTGDSDGDGTVDTQTRVTDATGQYAFEDIRPGTYTLTETPPTGSVATTPVSQTVTIGPGQIAVAFDGQQGLLAPVQTLSVLGNVLTFGNTYLGSIHGHKFNDVNTNQVDDNEPRLADVTITLVGDVDGDGDNDTVVTQTNATGDYAFENLYPGAYTVTETVPAGTFATTATTANVTITSGEEAVAITGQSILVGPLGPGQFESAPNDNLAFGNAFLGEIHGHKFDDVDGDGIEDPTEPRLQGFVIELRDAAGTLVASETTDVNGEYWFLSLAPGTYFVTEVQQDGYAQTTHDPQPINITGGQIYAGLLEQAEMITGDIREVFVDKCLIFGNTLTSSIFGYKFNDINADGDDEAGTDPRLAGVVITLTGDSDGDGTTDIQVRVTDATGQFAFENIRPGTYTLTETPPTGSVATTPVSQTVTVGPGQVAVAFDGQQGTLAPVQTLSVRGNELTFGNTYLGSIHGHKFIDVNTNQIDDNELRLADVTITLIGDVDGDGDNDTVVTQTNATGDYWFENLYPGSYTVTETVPAGTFATTATTANVTITSGEEAVAITGQSILFGPLGPGQFESAPNDNLAFGNAYLGEIHGHKFEDLDSDGIEDPAEPRLQGFVIELRNAAGALVASEITNANGEYWFLDLAPGTYFVTEVQQAGYAQTSHDPQPITITGGQIYAAQLDQAEMIPGDIREVFVDKCLSFGNTIVSSIHGFKFQDGNRNGIAEIATDQNQSGVSFSLTTSAGAAVLDVFGQVVPPAISDNAGTFAFNNLRPGTYVVTETVPTGQQPTSGAIARTFTVGYGIELVAINGQANLAVDDARTEQVIASAVGSDLDWGNAPLLGAIHGHKFSDLDGDGIEDDEDFRLNGWTITLTDAQGNAAFDAFGNAILPQQTADMDLNGDDVIGQNERGLYWFENLLPGTYLITETDQAGYEQTTHNPQPITITGGQVYVAQLDQAKTDPALDPDDAMTDVGFEEGRQIIVDKCLSFGNQLRGEVTWRKETKTGLLGGVIFTLTQTHTFDLETGALTRTLDRPITVADNLTPDVNGTFGLFNVIDLPLGRYTLVESFPVPGYDPDTTTVTFDLYPQTSLDDRFQDSPHVFFNTWSKRAFVGSTLAARLDYLEQIALADLQNNGGGDVGLPVTEDLFRVDFNVAEAEGEFNVTHTNSGNVVFRGGIADPLTVTTSDVSENIVISSLPSLRGALTVDAAGGNDVIELNNLNFQSIDGGDGYDILRLGAEGEFQLDDAASDLHSIEQIDVPMTGQRLMLTPGLVSRMSGDQPLTIRHQSSDQLEASDGWVLEDTVQENGRTVQIVRMGNAVARLINDHGWQNSLNRFDVNGNGQVTALDALVGINRLAATGGNGALAIGELPDGFVDVNGDGRVTALDALQVINHLGASANPVASGELVGSLNSASVAPVAASVSEADWDNSPLEAIVEELHATAGDQLPGMVASAQDPWSSIIDLGNDADDEDETESMLALLSADVGR